MNRTQLITLWVGIGVLLLMGLWPPAPRGGYDFILDAIRVSLSRLCIEWAIVAMLTGGLIYSLRVDPDLMLKIPCVFFYLRYSGKQSFEEILKDAKENKTNVVAFWWVAVILLLLALIAVRLSIPARSAPFILSR